MSAVSFHVLNLYKGNFRIRSEEFVEMNESNNNKKNKKSDNKWKAFQYLLQFGIWGIIFSIYIACYFAMTPYVHTFEGWTLAGFSIFGFGTASFFLIGVVVFYHDLKGKRMVKFFGS